MVKENNASRKKLIEETKTFISDALLELSNVIEKPIWRDILYFQRGTDTVQQISTRPDFLNIIPNAEFDGKLFALRKFADNLNNNDAFQEMKRKIIEETQIEWNWLSPHFIAHDVLYEYLWLVDSLNFNENISILVATNFVNFIYHPISNITFYSILRGVDSQIDSIELIDNMRIRKLELDEISTLIMRNESLRIKDHAPKNRILLEESFEFKYGRFPSDIFSSLAIKFDLIVESLRILKSGKVDRENIFWRWDKPGQLGNRELISSGRARSNPPITNTLIFKSEDVPSLMIIYKSLKTKSIPKAHQIAHHRFNEASQRAKPEDIIIDLCIALEALLNDGPGSVSYKLGMRAAILIGKTPEEKRHIVDLISDAYSLRSAFVHGATSKKSKKLKLSLPDLAEELLETFRRIFEASIEYQIDEKKALNPNDLDEMLLN